MKKTIAFIITAVMLLAFFAFPAAADSSELPFDLAAPANVSVKWFEGNDSPTTMSFAYSLDNSITSFFSQIERAIETGTYDEFMAQFPFDEIWGGVQIDWALDDVNDSVSGWHYNQYWEAGVNGVGYDEDFNWRVSEWDVVDWGFNNATETVQNVWIMRSTPDDERWNGNPDTHTPGVKDQLRPEQYSYYDDSVHIDFTQHTAYFRARLYFVTRTYSENGADDKYYFSDWSNVCAAGKDAGTASVITADMLPAPIISDLHMTDKEFNDNPIVAFTLTVPDEIAEMATRLASNGGYLYIEVYARVKGDTEWTQMQNYDRDIKAGEHECALIHLVNGERPVIAKDTEIELRCRYCCSQSGQDDIWSDYSEIITFGTTDISIGGETAAPETGKPDETNAPANEPDNSCPLCHKCSRPLGLCIWIWIAIIVLVIIIVVVIIIVSKKKKEK